MPVCHCSSEYPSSDQLVPPSYASIGLDCSTLLIPDSKKEIVHTHSLIGRNRQAGERRGDTEGVEYVN